MRVPDELAIILGEYLLRVQAPRMLAQGLHRSIVQGNFSLTSPLRRGYLSAVNAAANDQLSGAEIHGIPREASELAQPKSGVQCEDDHRPPSACRQSSRQ